MQNRDENAVSGTYERLLMRENILATASPREKNKKSKAKTIVDITSPVWEGYDYEAMPSLILTLLSTTPDIAKKYDRYVFYSIILGHLYGLLKGIKKRNPRHPEEKTSGIGHTITALNDAATIFLFSLIFTETLCVDIRLKGHGTKRPYFVSRETFGLLTIAPTLLGFTQFAASELLTDEASRIRFSTLAKIQHYILEPCEKLIIIESLIEFIEDLAHVNRDGDIMEMLLRYGITFFMGIFTHWWQNSHEDPNHESENHLNWHDYIEYLIGAICYLPYSILLAKTLYAEHKISDAELDFQYIFPLLSLLISTATYWWQQRQPVASPHSSVHIEEIHDEESAPSPAVVGEAPEKKSPRGLVKFFDRRNSMDSKNQALIQEEPAFNSSPV